MNRSLLAGRYAKALLAYAIESGEAEALYPIFGKLRYALRTSQGVVGNPTLSKRARTEAVVAMVGEGAPALFGRFVDLVFSHNRESLLADMAMAYVRLYRRHKGITFVGVRSAVPLDGQTQQRICELVRRERGGEIEMQVEVEEGLLGGFVLRVDGEVLDGSAKSAIERIRQQFINKNKTIV